MYIHFRFHCCIKYQHQSTDTKVKEGILPMEIVIICVLLVNLTGFVLMGYDKDCARAGRWRVPEKTLFSIALAGGAVGIFIGTHVFRHKTKHKLFILGTPVVIFTQVWVIGWLLVKSAVR